MARPNLIKKDSAVGTAIAVVCILVYLSALVYIIVRVNNSMERQRDAAENEFSILERIIREIPASDYMADYHKERIRAEIRRSRVIEGVIISGELGDAFEKTEGRALTQSRDYPVRLIDRFDFIKLGPYPIRVDGQRNVVIEARASRFNYSELAGFLTDALLLIIAALVLSFITLLIESRRKGKSKKDLKTERPQSPKIKKDEEIRHYSKWGIISEEDTESRLTEELQRSIKESYDMAFITMEFKMPVPEGDYGRFALDAARFFSSRDFVCEKGNKGISVICPSLNVETAFLNADEFHNRIMGKYPGLLASKTDLCIGITARSERHVIAERMIFEAEEALERAMMDPVSHIVAFKCDPQKYKEFMEAREE